MFFYLKFHGPYLIIKLKKKKKKKKKKKLNPFARS